MRLRTKVIATAMVTVFLASVGAVGVASAQGDHDAIQYATLRIQAVKQVTPPGKPIEVSGSLTSISSFGFPDGTIVKVYAQRLGTTSVFGREIGRRSAPVLVATASIYFRTGWQTSLTFKQTGDYYVYATFDGGADVAGSTYGPSQSGMMAVKVTSVPGLVLRKPTNLMLWTTQPMPPHVSSVSTPLEIGATLQSGANTRLENKPVSFYYQFKAGDSDGWGAPVLLSTSFTSTGTGLGPGGEAGVSYTPTQPGYYRFQAKFAGDPSFRVWGYDGSTSNYVDLLITTAVINPPS